MDDIAAVGDNQLVPNKLIDRIGVTQSAAVPDLLAGHVELVVAAYDHLRTAILARREPVIGPFGIACAWLDALALTDGPLWDTRVSEPRLTRFGAAILAQVSFDQVGIEWPAKDEARRLGDCLMERLVVSSASEDAKGRSGDTPELPRFLGEVNLSFASPYQVKALASAVAASVRGASTFARAALGRRLRRLGDKLLADATQTLSTPMSRIADFASAIACYEAELDCYGQGLGFQATGRLALADAYLSRYQVFAEMFNAGDLKDLDAAIRQYRHAVVDLEEDWPTSRQALLSCARALLLRYKLNKSVSDLDAALAVYLQVERREPKRVLGQVGWDWLEALEQRVTWPKAGRYHDQKVRLTRRLLAESREGSVESGVGRMRLGNAYAQRAERRRSDSDLDQAIDECAADRNALLELSATNENR